MNLETKEINIPILGKDGEVQTLCMQRHLPTTKMNLFVTSSGHFMVCQENHPIIILPVNENDITTVAANIAIEGDKIFVDNTICQNSDSIIPDINVSTILNIINELNIDSEITQTDYIKGNYNNFRLNSNFIKYDNNWLKELILNLIKIYNNKKYITTSSYNFISQLKFICDKLGWFSKLSNVYQHDLFNTFVLEIDDTVKSEHIKDYKEITNIIVIDKWHNYVYDIKTNTSEFMSNCVQTHNSFHCNKKEMLVYVDDNNKKRVVSFEQLWDENPNDIILNENQEEKDVENLNIWDYDKFVKVTRIIRHKKHPATTMRMVRSNNGDFSICQDNHPIILSENKSICDKCNTPFTKPKREGYWLCATCGKHPHKIEHEPTGVYTKVEPKCIVKSKYFSCNSFPIWQQEKIELKFDAYALGFFLAEGSYIKNYNNTPHNFYGIRLSQTENTIEHNNIYNILKDGYDVRLTTNTINIYDRNLAQDLFDEFGEYSHSKSLGVNYIYFSDEDLSKILCGFIDGDGSFILNDDRVYISTESTSLKLIQQLHHILDKFNIDHNITAATVKKLTRNQSYILKIYPTSNDIDIFKHSTKIDVDSFPKKYNRNRYPSLVTYNKEIMFDENEYVYDLTTESGMLTINGMRNSNTGGAADLSRVNILEELISNIESKYESSLKSMLQQKENDLITLVNNTSIIIDRSIYIDKNQLKINPTEIILPLAYFTLNIGDMSVSVTSEKPAIIYYNSTDYEEKDNKIIIKYKNGDKIAKFEPLQLKSNEIAKYIDTLVGGGSPWTTPESLFMKFYNTLQHFSDWDSVHMEVVISTILRNKDNPQIPARLKEPYNPSTHSVKNLPSLISWPLGLGFENFGKSITYGMISDRADPSEIEKVLLGEPLSDLSVELIKKEIKARRKK